MYGLLPILFGEVTSGFRRALALLVILLVVITYPVLAASQEAPPIDWVTCVDSGVTIPNDGTPCPSRHESFPNFYFPQIREYPHIQEYPHTIRQSDGSLKPEDGYRWLSERNQNDFRVERVPAGTPSTRYPNVVWTQDGQLRPMDGFTWMHNPPNGDFRVIPIPDGTRSRYPNVEWRNGQLWPVDGYRWISGAPRAGNFQVERVPSGTPSRENPHLIWGKDGIRHLEDGYMFGTNGRVVLVPNGTGSTKYAHVVWNGNGELKPVDGYRWASKEPWRDNYAVERVPPGTPSRSHPHVVWTADGQLRPAPGYQWVPNKGLEVQPRLAGEAAELVNAFEKASTAMKLPKEGRHENMSLNCSQYFRQLGKELMATGNRQEYQHPEWTQETLQANDIINVIQHSTRWFEVSEKDAQKLANMGVIVAGVAPSSIHNGHIGVVFPAPPGYTYPKPVVRDGNEHPPERNPEHRLFPGTWGAVRADRAFSAKEPPTWYMWVPSAKHAVSTLKEMRAQ